MILLNSKSSELTEVKNKGTRKNKAGNKKEISFCRKLSSFTFQVYTRVTRVCNPKGWCHILNNSRLKLPAYRQAGKLEYVEYNKSSIRNLLAKFLTFEPGQAKIQAV